MVSVQLFNTDIIIKPSPGSRRDSSATCIKFEVEFELAHTMVDIGTEIFFKAIETELTAGIAGLSIFTEYCLDPVQRKLNKSNKSSNPHGLQLAERQVHSVDGEDKRPIRPDGS